MATAAEESERQKWIIATFSPMWAHRPRGRPHGHDFPVLSRRRGFKQITKSLKSPAFLLLCGGVVCYACYT